VAGDNSTRGFVGRRLPALLLGALLLAHGLSNWIWLRTYTEPLLGETSGWDTGWHLRNTMILAASIRQAARSGRGPLHVVKEVVAQLSSERDKELISPSWPRLMYLVAALPCLVLGPSGRVVEMTNLFWLSLLLVSTYLIGAACRDRWTGLLAAVLVSLTPAVFCLSRRFELDFALCAAVALACYTLIRTEGFTRTGWSVAFGVVSGLGLMVKAQLLLFLLPPCLFLAGQEPVARLVALVRRRRQLEEGAPPRRRLFRPCALALLSAGIAAAISSAWWAGAFREHVGRLIVIVDPRRYGFSPDIHPVDPLFYLGSIIEGVTPFLFIPIAAGSVLALRDRRAQHRALLLLWALGAFAIFSLRFGKQGRFIFPVLPALALLAAIGWRRMVDTSSRWRRAAAVAVAVLVGLNGLAQYVGISFASWGVTHAWSWSAPVQRRLLDPTFVPGKTWHYLWLPRTERRRREERRLSQGVDRFIARATAELGRAPRIGVVGHPFLTRAGYPCLLRTGSYFTFRLLSSRPEEAVDFEGHFQAFFDQPLVRTDYVIGTAPGLIDPEMEKRLRQQLAEDVLAGVEDAWQELSARIRTIRGAFTRRVAESEWFGLADFMNNPTPGKLRLYLWGRGR
jgi:hypothetical protein